MAFTEEYSQSETEHLVFNTPLKPDYNERYLAGDNAWIEGVEAEKEQGIDAAAPHYEDALKNYVSAVWWRKSSDPELDYVFSLKLAGVQTKLAAYDGLTAGDGYDRRKALFDAADFSYRRAETRLERNSDTMTPDTLSSIQALIGSQRADMNTARGHFPEATQDLDGAVAEIAANKTDSHSISLIREQIVVQRAIIQEAEARRAIKAEPKTPADFLLELVTNTELAKV